MKIVSQNPKTTRRDKRKDRTSTRKKNLSGVVLPSNGFPMLSVSKREDFLVCLFECEPLPRKELKETAHPEDLNNNEKKKPKRKTVQVQ